MGKSCPALWLATLGVAVTCKVHGPLKGSPINPKLISGVQRLANQPQKLYWTKSCTSWQCFLVHVIGVHESQVVRNRFRAPTYMDTSPRQCARSPTRLCNQKRCNSIQESRLELGPHQFNPPTKGYLIKDPKPQPCSMLQRPLRAGGKPTRLWPARGAPESPSP